MVVRATGSAHGAAVRGTTPKTAHHRVSAWLCLMVAIIAASIPSTSAFSTSFLSLKPRNLQGPASKHPLPWSMSRNKPKCCGLTMQTEDYKKYGTEFDLLSGKDFDLLALRSFRREAKLRYSNLNQSEPLRILIFGTLAVLAASASAIADGVEMKVLPALFCPPSQPPSLPIPKLIQLHVSS